MSKRNYYENYGGSAPENYQRYFVPAIGAPLAADLIGSAAPRSGERVLDVACGTGTVTRLAAERVAPEGTIAGVDSNPGMLAVARAVTPPGLAIAWHEAPAEALPLPDGAFDVVLCQLGLQFFADRPAAVREMQRVLAPGGRVVVNLPGPTPPLFAVMEEALTRHLDAEAGAFVQQVFSLNDAAELHRLLDDAGFGEVAVRCDTRTLRLPAPEHFLWQYVQSTPLMAAAAQLDDERRTALERDVVARWQPFVDDGALLLHLPMAVVTAEKQRVLAAPS